MAAPKTSVQVTWLDRLPPSVKAALEPLTAYERRFVQLYCGPCRGNQTAAAMALRRRMQPKKHKSKKAVKKALATVSYARAASIGSQLLMQPLVRQAVNAWMDAVALSAAEVTFKIADLANANVGPFIQLVPVGKKRKDGTRQLQPQLRVDDAATWEAHQHWIKKVKTSPRTGKVIELELHDSFAAMKEAAKILKLTSDQQPTLALNIFFQQLTDQQVLAELNRAFAEVEAQRHDQGRLPPGDPVQVVPPPPDPDEDS